MTYAITIKPLRASIIKPGDIEVEVTFKATVGELIKLAELTGEEYPGYQFKTMLRDLTSSIIERFYVEFKEGADE